MRINFRDIYNQATEILKKVYGADAKFREGQYEAIEGIVPTDANLEYLVPCTLHNAPGTASALIIGSADLNLTGIGQYQETNLQSVQLNWNDVGDEDTVYLVHRSTYHNFTPSDTTVIGNTTLNSYTDYEPLTNRTNYYRIVAADSFTLEQLGMSSTVNVKATIEVEEVTEVAQLPSQPVEQVPVVQEPVSVPQSPIHTGVQITDNTTSGISLTATSQYGVVNLFWNAPSNGNHQYYIFRSTKSDFTPSSSTQIGKNFIITDTAFTDSDTTSGNVYYYKVLAYNRTTNEKSGESNLLQIET